MKHKYEMEFMKGTKALAILLAMITSTTFSGCGKKSECKISENHLHKYVNDNGYVRYIDKEFLKYEGYCWSSDYMLATKDELENRNFENKKNLLRIDENLDKIITQQKANVDYIEYRYSYIYLMPIPHTISTGKTTTLYFTYIPMTNYSWTNDPNHSNLTGEERLCHIMYQAYKIETNEKGKKVLIPSKYVDDLQEVMDEYPYIKEKYSKVFVPELNCEADYEDGPEEELTQEELEKRYANIDPNYKDSVISNIVTYVDNGFSRRLTNK